MPIEFRHIQHRALRPTPLVPMLAPSCFHHHKYYSAACSFRISRKEIPARDRVIDLGKYKGKMLGSLPSSYLKWVSKNLRARDMEEWARLADQVLGDPVYRDRIEWELAEKILNGNTESPSPCPSRGNNSNAVSELLEISRRFGWDNEDKQGWSEIDFKLLGTSRGGRIPRLAAAAGAKEEEEKITKAEVDGTLGEEISGGRRRERRERMRQRRRRMPTDVGHGGGCSMSSLQEEDRTGGLGGGDAYADGAEGIKFKDEDDEQIRGIEGSSLFPGRQALLDKLRLRHHNHNRKRPENLFF